MLNKFEQTFFDIAKAMSNLSKDDRKKVGAIITDSNFRIISSGYNGYVSKINDEAFVPEDRLALTIHAEINAILSAKRDLTGCYIFIYPCMPCSHCAIAIAQAGIKKVYSWEATHSDKWRTDLSWDIFADKGIQVICGNTHL